MKNIMVEELCSLHTNLSKEEVQIIQELVGNLPLIADLNKANIFVDCLTKEGKHAIVVAEAAPTTAKPVYKNPVVGKFAYEAFEPSVFYTLRTGKPMFQNWALTQEGKTVDQSVIPIKAPNDRVIGALIMEKDISKQLQHQRKMEALSEATETLSEILIGMTKNQPIIPEMIEESLFFIDQEGKILYCNPSAINLIQEIGENESSIGKRIVSYFPKIEGILKEPEELLIQEVKMLNKIFQVKKIKLGQFEKANGTLVVFKNITELREKERELIVKSVAIREIHHRVKNNLQTVASLLRLQMRRGLPEESKVHFVESLNRITSIASVYEIILSNSSVDDVDIHQLLEKIGNMLVWESEHENKRITISYTGQHLQIKSNIAVSVALVVNELIQNCVKHAFKTMTEGQIEILFQQNGKDIEVQVKDNGIGYSPNSKPSLGLDIVRMMVEHDLAGHFSIIQTEKGTLASITFPVEREMILA